MSESPAAPTNGRQKSRTSGGLLGNGPSASTLPVPDPVGDDPAPKSGRRHGRRADGDSPPADGGGFSDGSFGANMTSFDATNASGVGGVSPSARRQSPGFGAAATGGSGIDLDATAARSEPRGPRKADALESFLRASEPTMTPHWKK